MKTRKKLRNSNVERVRKSRLAQISNDALAAADRVPSVRNIGNGTRKTAVGVLLFRPKVESRPEKKILRGCSSVESVRTLSLVP